MCHVQCMLVLASVVTVKPHTLTLLDFLMLMQRNIQSPQARAMHVYSEAERVLKFDAVCSDRDGGASPGREGMHAATAHLLAYSVQASCE
jgi:hypothetical protein